MDFFQHQDQARRNTLWLIVLLALAVLSLIALTTVLLTFIIYYFQFGTGIHLQAFEQNTTIFEAAAHILSLKLVLSISLAIIAIVALGSAFKWLQLRAGGEVIAASMGGRRLNANSSDHYERQVLNVVEEMAIASGTPVPPVYLLDEDGINAFAAGYEPQDAVIGVTRGCIQLLNRQELQGVIAHEFSHILHGDMRLNIRLIGLLHGILVIGLLGQLLVRGSARQSYAIGNRRNNNGGIMAAGAGLMVIGYAGTFFGNLIKAAVSRQREFLADASAVQFTRDPSGISGALQKIGGYSAGSELQHANAAEYSHLYFSQGIKTLWGGLMATHPPLPLRIKRIQPSWAGNFPSIVLPAQVEVSTNNSALVTPVIAPAQTQPATNSAAAILEQSHRHSGQPTTAHLQHAHAVLTSIPNAIKEAANEPFAARALMYGLLLSQQDAIRQQQFSNLQKGAHPIEFKHFVTVADDLSRLDETCRLPLIELAIPTLKLLSPSQYEVFKRNLIMLIRADSKVSLPEWAMYRILRHNLEPAAKHSTHKTIAQSAIACQYLLSLIAQYSREPQAAYTAGQQVLALSQPFLTAEQVHLPSVDTALEQLAQLKPLQKPLLLKALSRTIGHDNELTITEIELFRAIADSLNCPVPPLLIGNKPI